MTADELDFYKMLLGWALVGVGIAIWMWTHPR